MWYLVAADCTLALLWRISPIASWREWVLRDFMSSGVIAGKASGTLFPLFWVSEYSERILYSAAIILSNREPLPWGFLEPELTLFPLVFSLSDTFNSMGLLFSSTDPFSCISVGEGLCSAMSSSSLSSPLMLP